MTDPVDRPGQSDDAIDAQFEPAPPSADHVVMPEKQRKGPGWIALIATGLVASALGGGFGASFGSGAKAVGPASGSASDLVEQQAGLIAALEADQSKLESRLAALGADLEQAETRLTAEITRAAEQAGNGQDEDVGDDLAALAARVDLLSALPEGAEGEDTSILSNRLVAFEQALADLQAGQGNRAEALASLSTRVEAAEATLTQAGERIDQSQLVSLHEEISTLKSQLGEAVSDTAEREKLTDLISRAEERDAASRIVSRQSQSSGNAALALLSLEAASERGVPFPEVMRALDAANADAGILEDLRPIAQTGAPTADKLGDLLYRGLLTARAQEIGSTGEEGAPAEDGWGWVRRTFGDSVKITRSGDESSDGYGSDSLEKTANLAGEALGVGNVSGAIAELGTLEEADRAPFTPWIEAAERRVRLDAALIALRASMLEQGR